MTKKNMLKLKNIYFLNTINFKVTKTMGSKLKSSINGFLYIHRSPLRTFIFHDQECHITTEIGNKGKS